MKRFIIFTTIGIWMISTPSAFAEIKNGYEKKLILAEQSIRNLNSLSQEGYAESLRKNLEKRRKKTTKLVNKLREYYQRTQVLIVMLQRIDPDLYHDINTIRDSEGHPTDVYIKIVDGLGSDYVGMTNLKQSKRNPHVHNSEYGDHSVSVLVARSYSAKVLKILVHELGHVRYQVPHLASYVKYYQKTYQNQYYRGKGIGHSSSDPSHRSVLATLKAFEISWKAAKEAEKVITSRNSKNRVAFAK